ncbi:MAG TPA: DNA-formamidopyrimidine glycosylase family protein [Acidimicrobiales bacterium]
MPEGDTLHRTANRLRPALAGQPLVRLTLHHATGGGRRPETGERIETVEAVGKHLLIRFEHGATLRTHLRMTGSWHLYRSDERWRKGREFARAIVEVDGWTAVCFAAPVVELTDPATAASKVAHLGPDLTRTDVTDADIDRAVDRMASLVRSGDEIAVVLLDQRVASGIGNVFKSEVLFACGVDPFAPVGRIDVETRRRLVATASRMLRRNTIEAGPRTTVLDGASGARRLAVYGRSRRPCHRCGTPIKARRQGEHARTTYWCPSCQPRSTT